MTTISVTRFGDPVIDDYTTKAVGIYLLLSQDREWNDIEGNTVLIEDMSVSYKRNVLKFLTRRATGMGRAYTWGQMMAVTRGGFSECAAPHGDGGCGATHEWAHGVFHGSVFPGSEIENMLDAENEATMNLVEADPIRWLYGTTLGARLRDDINKRIGGHIS